MAAIKPQWATKVEQAKIRRLYELDARGLADDALIDEVGIALYSRCHSIVTVTEAEKGRVHCPQCSTLITHPRNKAFLMVCPTCRWEMTWGTYRNTYQGQELVGGGAVFAFTRYVEQYPRATSARSRMLLIDQLIHAFHSELTQHPARPAAINLIEGNLRDVLLFLDRLTYGADSSPDLLATKSRWRENWDRSQTAVKFAKAVMDERDAPTLPDQ